MSFKLYQKAARVNSIVGCLVYISMNKNNMRFSIFKNLHFSVCVFTLFVTVAFLPQIANGQSDEKATHQQKTETLLLIEKAEQNPYRVSHIYFTGNGEVRDRILRLKINERLSEGDIFTQEKLYQGLEKLSELEVIYEVTLEDVKVELDEENRDINLTITVREKPLSK